MMHRKRKRKPKKEKWSRMFFSLRSIHSFIVYLSQQPKNRNYTSKWSWNLSGQENSCTCKHFRPRHCTALELLPSALGKLFYWSVHMGTTAESENLRRYAYWIPPQFEKCKSLLWKRMCSPKWVGNQTDTMLSTSCKCARIYWYFFEIWGAWYKCLVQYKSPFEVKTANKKDSCQIFCFVIAFRMFYNVSMFFSLFYLFVFIVCLLYTSDAADD